MMKRLITVCLALLMLIQCTLVYAEDAPLPAPGEVVEVSAEIIEETPDEEPAEEPGEEPAVPRGAAAPAFLTVTQSATSHVYLEWAAVEGAESYELQRSVGGGAYARVKDITGATNTYNYSLSQNTQYQYRIRARVGGVLGDFCESAVFTLTPVPAQVTGVTLEQSGTKDVAISWNALSGIDYYELYRKVDDKDWAKVKNIGADLTETLNWGLAKDSQYSYRLRGVREISSLFTAYGAWSEAKTFSLSTGSTAPAKVTGLKATQEGTQHVFLEWNAVSGAEYYELYRKVGDAEWAKVKNITGATSTYNYSLSKDVVYGYKVRAVKGSSFGAFSDPVNFSLAAAVAQVKNLKATQNGTQHVFLEWDAVSGVEYYELYRKVGDAEWTKVKNVYDATSTYNYSLTKGVVYGYKVRAYNAGVYGPFSDPVNFSLVEQTVAQVKNLRVTQSAKAHVLIEWDEVAGADYYELYRKVGDADWTKVKNVTGATSTYNYSLTQGVAYGYRVRAVKGSIFGAYAEDVFFTLFGTGLKVANLKVTQSAKTHVNIEWDAVEGADAYQLYRSVDGGEFAWVKDVTGATSTPNYSLSKTSVYQYKVRAKKTIAGAAYYTEYSDAFTFTLFNDGAQVADLSVSQSADGKAVLAWTAFANADAYEIERSADAGATWTKIGDAAEATFADAAAAGTEYAYRVRAAKTVAGATYYSQYSEQVTFELFDPSVKVENLVVTQATKNSVRIAWDEISGVDGYELYRAVDGGEFTRVKSINNATETYNYSLVEGSEYSYKVRAFKVIDGEDVFAQFSDEASILIYTKPAEPACVDVIFSEDIYLDWEVSGQCDGYRIYKSENRGELALIAEVSADTTSYVLDLQIHSVLYNFVVTAYHSVGETVYESDPGSTWDWCDTTVQNLKWRPSGESNITLSWDALACADKYLVLDSNYTQIAEVTEPACTLAAPEEESVYYVQAVAMVDESTSIGSLEASITAGGALTYGDFEYSYNAEGDGIVITAYNGSAASVTVPATIDSLPIVEIGDGAFENNSTLTSIDLPDTVEIIGVRAFSYCTSLTSMT